MYLYVLLPSKKFLKYLKNFYNTFNFTVYSLNSGLGSPLVRGCGNYYIRNTQNTLLTLLQRPAGQK